MTQNIYLAIMRKILFALLILSSSILYSQSNLFHFDDTITTLIKNTNQSPAHWYLEIYSDCEVDTTLRWKASFVNIPNQWNINFDDQTTFHTTINDGDSADFLLETGLPFPEKLIIGAAFNYYPGVGSILFDIYDPYNPSELVTIEYHYIVGQNALTDLEENLAYTRKGDVFMFNEDLLGAEISIVSLDGKIISQHSIDDPMLNLEDLNQGFYFIQIQHGLKNYVIKEYFSN